MNDKTTADLLSEYRDLTLALTKVDEENWTAIEGISEKIVNVRADIARRATEEQHERLLDETLESYFDHLYTIFTRSDSDVFAEAMDVLIDERNLIHQITKAN